MTRNYYYSSCICDSFRKTSLSRKRSPFMMLSLAMGHETHCSCCSLIQDSVNIYVLSGLKKAFLITTNVNFEARIFAYFYGFTVPTHLPWINCGLLFLLWYEVNMLSNRSTVDLWRTRDWNVWSTYMRIYSSTYVHFKSITNMILCIN